jgi:outer membrane protein TolC
MLDLQQEDPRARADISVGYIKLEWGLFEGGRRVGELRIQDSKIRSAVAQADSIADNIRFQVTEAYRLLVTAREGIDRSRPAVEQATGNYRLVLARYRTGDATSSEITDALDNIVLPSATGPTPNADFYGYPCHWTVTPGILSDLDFSASPLVR